MAPRSRSRRASARRSSMRATSSARRSSRSRSASRRRRRHDDRVLGRPRPARHADPPRPDADDRGRLRRRRVDLRRARARAGRGGGPPARRGRPRRREAGGVLLIPSFAIGRTQEIVWELDRLIERGEIPQLPLYLDSPMAIARHRHLPRATRSSTTRRRASCSQAARPRSTTRTSTSPGRSTSRRRSRPRRGRT